MEKAANLLMEEISRVIVGQKQTIRLMVAGLFAGGHILIEGVPGIAKTLAARVMAKALGIDFARIQFTPDLMPGDLTGSSVYHPESGKFQFHKGPAFTNLLLADEINRAPAKTQSALFEVMEESSITVDGVTHRIPPPFMVIATQNPIEMEGTYNLPEAQLDRFMIRLKMDYPDLEDEILILHRFKSDFYGAGLGEVSLCMHQNELLKIRDAVQQIFISDELVAYLAGLVTATRQNKQLILGGSPRATLSLLRMAKAMAGISGRDYVIPEDVQDVAFAVLSHRLMLDPEKELSGVTAEDVLNEIIRSIPVPR
jgi:MoxR-like ATPase